MNASHKPVPGSAVPGKTVARAGRRDPNGNEEPHTTAWFALRLGPSEFAIFDAFPDDSGRQAHLSGKVAEALMAQAADLFAQPPEIKQADVIAAKLPG